MPWQGVNLGFPLFGAKFHVYGDFFYNNSSFFTLSEKMECYHKGELCRHNSHSGDDVGIEGDDSENDIDAILRSPDVAPVLMERPTPETERAKTRQGHVMSVA